METKELLEELIKRVYDEIENYPSTTNTVREKETIRLYFDLLDYKERYF